MAIKAKVIIGFKSGGELTYTVNREGLHEKYVDRHINDPDVKSITVQLYPKKNHAPIDWIAKRQEQQAQGGRLNE